MTGFMKTWRRVGNTDLFQGGKISLIINTNCLWAIKTKARKEMVLQPAELKVTLKTNQWLREQGIRATSLKLGDLMATNVLAGHISAWQASYDLFIPQICTEHLLCAFAYLLKTMV